MQIIYERWKKENGKKKRGKCVEKMEKLKRREDTVNRDEKKLVGNRNKTR